MTWEEAASAIPATLYALIMISFWLGILVFGQLTTWLGRKPGVRILDRRIHPPLWGPNRQAEVLTERGLWYAAGAIACLRGFFTLWLIGAGLMLLAFLGTFLLG